MLCKPNPTLALCKLRVVLLHQQWNYTGANVEKCQISLSISKPFRELLESSNAIP